MCKIKNTEASRRNVLESRVKNVKHLNVRETRAVLSTSSLLALHPRLNHDAHPSTALSLGLPGPDQKPDRPVPPMITRSELQLLPLRAVIKVDIPSTADVHPRGKTAFMR
jgi:hypothetical protein